MKRRVRILCLLVSALVVFAMFPLQASAAGTDYNADFKKVTAANLQSYYSSPPKKGGEDQSAAQINRELTRISSRTQLFAPVPSSIIVKKSLVFSATKGGKVFPDDAYKQSQWTKTSGKTIYTYTERKFLVAQSADPVEAAKLATFCEYAKKKGKTTNSYGWYKKDTVGYHNKLIGPSKPPKMTNCKKYNDALVFKQKCFVYSYIPKGKKDTVYKYVSRETGQTLKTITVDLSGYSETEITFVEKNATKAAKFFAKPKGVTFTKNF